MKKVLFLCFAVLMSAAAAFAQDKEISGTVYDSSGEGLAGVGVMVKGTTVGTMTALDGSCTLKVPEHPQGSRGRGSRDFLSRFPDAGDFRFRQEHFRNHHD